jgi:hypothetical protein
MGWEGGLDEYRGQSWCIGGDPNATTLFNFLKTYNSSIIGGSLGHHIIGMTPSPYYLFISLVDFFTPFFKCLFYSLFLSEDFS